MNPRLALSLSLALVLLGCATPASLDPKHRFEGWLKYRGEVMLFNTQADYLASTKPRPGASPRCVSGVLAGNDRNLRPWDGRRVIITGRLVNYESLKDENRVVIPRKMLARKIISNFCLRDQIILITSLRRA